MGRRSDVAWPGLAPSASRQEARRVDDLTGVTASEGPGSHAPPPSRENRWKLSPPRTESKMLDLQTRTEPRNRLTRPAKLGLMSWQWRRRRRCRTSRTLRPGSPTRTGKENPPPWWSVPAKPTGRRFLFPRNCSRLPGKSSTSSRRPNETGSKSIAAGLLLSTE